MSDPLTNVEIDDVLSSIRRLVSEHPEKPQGAPRGKLVLTPSLRVDEPVETAETVAADENSAPNSAPVEPETHPRAAPANDAIDADSLRPGSQSLEQRIAELEEAVAASAGEWEPDGTEPGAGALPSDMPPVFGAGQPANDQPWNAREATKPPTDEARPSPDRREPDRPTPDRAEPGLFEPEAEETVLDEEMLRDLVAELVREELQGALGERITRNVRKLVRAEVQRALAARDLG